VPGRSLLIVVSLLALAVGASGCGQRSEPTGALAQSYPVTVAGAGETPTAIGARPERIVALDAGSAEMVAGLGAADRLVGIPAGVDVGAAEQPAVVVKPNRQVDVDAVVRLRPDLIVATAETDQVDLAQAERRTNAAAYLQPSRSIEDVERAALELGFLLGQPAEARQLVGRIKSGVADVEERLDGVDPVRTFVDTGFMITVSDRSLVGELVRRAHGDNVAGSYEGLGPFPAARLRKADPAVYLATSDSGVTLEKLRRDPGTRKLDAVEKGRVEVVPVDLVTSAGPRVATALETIAAALHPDAFR
jgi:cobalamin transport system substrate-binding protein